MEQAFPVRQRTPANANQIIDDMERDPRAARDVATGEQWVFFEHRSLAEIFAAEQRP